LGIPDAYYRKNDASKPINKKGSQKKFYEIGLDDIIL